MHRLPAAAQDQAPAPPAPRPPLLPRRAVTHAHTRPAPTQPPRTQPARLLLRRQRRLALGEAGHRHVVIHIQNLGRRRASSLGRLRGARRGRRRRAQARWPCPTGRTGRPRTRPRAGPGAACSTGAGRPSPRRGRRGGRPAWARPGRTSSAWRLLLLLLRALLVCLGGLQRLQWDGMQPGAWPCCTTHIVPDMVAAARAYTAAVGDSAARNSPRPPPPPLFTSPCRPPLHTRSAQARLCALVGPQPPTNPSPSIPPALSTCFLSRARSSFSAVLRTTPCCTSRRRRRAMLVWRLSAGVAPSNTNTGRTRWKSSLWAPGQPHPPEAVRQARRGARRGRRGTGQQAQRCVQGRGQPCECMHGVVPHRLADRPSDTEDTLAGLAAHSGWAPWGSMGSLSSTPARNQRMHEAASRAPPPLDQTTVAEPDRRPLRNPPPPLLFPDKPRGADLQMRLKKPSRCALRIMSPLSSRMAFINWNSQMEASGQGGLHVAGGRHGVACAAGSVTLWPCASPLAGGCVGLGCGLCSWPAAATLFWFARFSACHGDRGHAQANRMNTPDAPNTGNHVVTFLRQPHVLNGSAGYVFVCVGPPPTTGGWSPTAAARGACLGPAGLQPCHYEQRRQALLRDALTDRQPLVGYGLDVHTPPHRLQQGPQTLDAHPPPCAAS